MKPLQKYLQEVLQTKYLGNLAEFARAARLHRNQLERYIYGDTAPTTDTLEKIAAVLDVTPAFLLMNHEERMQLIQPDWLTRLKNEGAKPAHQSPSTIQTRLAEVAEHLHDNEAGVLLTLAENYLKVRGFEAQSSPKKPPTGSDRE